MGVPKCFFDGRIPGLCPLLGNAASSAYPLHDLVSECKELEKMFSLFSIDPPFSRPHFLVSAENGDVK
jgi:hypothetical protein